MLVPDALKDQVVLLTGGGTGLGKSMARYFLSLGAKLLISSRKMDVLERAAAELREQTGGEVLPLSCDIRDTGQVEQMFETGRQHYGNIDVVVNNAAANFISPTERLSANAFHTILDIVLKGTANVTLAAGKDWIEKKQAGVFLNILTTYAFTGSAYVVPSAAAKAGVLAMTRSLAVEWASYGIRSNAIAPGPFPTEGAWERLLPGEFAAQFDPARRVPLGRVGEHQELANLAAYLISPYASYVNGEIITIDGGEWLQGAGQFNGLKAVSNSVWDDMEKKRKNR
ncbi:NAD(P)-dependent dehydrogenase, short-chain alcohol dehydrogenase family [Cyclobacterium lianum]|uniref:NAD(P)-dependent dehydrogenase, short-chain alcohol dehydrogenase family n=2 Tax=Cyclobacterium lianum TaxID=388280 RepID=A0A1M7Q829_9BACT|nr:NAD(P)-dependent dehydrogenase, short-chain alcohol dehydrogenase family [Cyclobacterium lianum]